MCGLLQHLDPLTHTHKGVMDDIAACLAALASSEDVRRAVFSAGPTGPQRLLGLVAHRSVSPASRRDIAAFLCEVAGDGGMVPLLLGLDPGPVAAFVQALTLLRPVADSYVDTTIVEPVARCLAAIAPYVPRKVRPVWPSPLL
jgi:hypothetical protein